MSDTFTTDLSDALDLTSSEVDAFPADHRVTVPIAENITEAMENAPLGSLYDIVYAALARRLKKVLEPESSLGGLMSRTFVSTVQFRAVNPSYSNELSNSNAAAASNSGAGSYRSKVWGPSPNEKIPFTLPDPVATVPYAMGADPGSEQNKGLFVAKLYADLQQHLPLVLFNVTAKEYVPIGIGGSSYGRRYWQGGNVITEVVYRANLTVEATCTTESDSDTSRLQSLVEATFGPMRDHIDTGAVVNGRTWQLCLPLTLSPSAITETDAPWSQGDDKGAKLYTATVELMNLSFECVTTISKPMRLQISDNAVEAGSMDAASFSIPGETGDFTAPLRLKLGQKQRLIVNGMPITADIAISQSKRVIELRLPRDNNGTYEIVPKRTGEAILRVYDTHMSTSLSNPNPPVGRVASPLFERRVVVTAV